MLAGAVLADQYATVDCTDVAIVAIDRLTTSLLACGDDEVLTSKAFLTEVVGADLSILTIAWIKVALGSLSVACILSTGILVVTDCLMDACVSTF